MKELLAVGRLADPAVEQHLREQRRSLQPRRQCLGLGMRRLNDPLFGAMHPCHPTGVKSTTPAFERSYRQ
jgi:hypothetical protein